MSTEYQQVPSQQTFGSHSDVDPWLISTSHNVNINWGPKHIKRNLSHSPPFYEAEIRWSSPPSTPSSTPPLLSIKRPIVIPTSQFNSTSSLQDPWAIIQDEEIDIDDDASSDSMDSDDGVAQDLYKTELCRSYVETGTCRYGLKCQFAHGRHELRPVVRHPKYKTEICKTFHTLGTCPYGTRCRFIHTRPINGANVGSEPASPPSPTYASPLSLSPASRSPSPPAVVPSKKWSSSWSKATPAQSQAQEKEKESEVPVESGSPTHSSKKRLAIFRTIC